MKGIHLSPTQKRQLLRRLGAVLVSAAGIGFIAVLLTIPAHPEHRETEKPRTPIQHREYQAGQSAFIINNHITNNELAAKDLAEHLGTGQDSTDRFEEKSLAKKRAASVLIDIAINHEERIAELMKQ